MATVEKVGDSLASFASRLWTPWERFWFTPTDPTPLGLIRLLAGFLVLYVHIAYCYDLEAFFGDKAWIDSQTINLLRAEGPVGVPPSGWDQMQPPENSTPDELAYEARFGIHPRLLYSRGHPELFSIWYLVSDPLAMRIVHGAILAIMFCFAIGLCTRITGVLTWLSIISYFNRAPTSLFGMDTMMNIVVIYLVIAPSGAALSVDRLLARFWATRQAFKKHRPAPEFQAPAPRISANVALRLMQVHFCIIYLVSGVTKLQGQSWWNGTAVWGTMANYEFAPMQIGLYMKGLQFMAEHRWLWELITTGGSYFTLAFEIGFMPAMIIGRWLPSVRATFIVCAICLHLGIAITMGLVTFSMFMLMGVLSFVPAAVIHQMLRRLGRGRPAVTARLAA
jgi:hypothetical protein